MQGRLLKTTRPLKTAKKGETAIRLGNYPVLSRGDSDI